MKTYIFWIKRYWYSEFERIEIEAENSLRAIANLPHCVDWNFSLKKADY